MRRSYVLSPSYQLDICDHWCFRDNGTMLTMKNVQYEKKEFFLIICIIYFIHTRE